MRFVSLSCIAMMRLVIDVKKRWCLSMHCLTTLTDEMFKAREGWCLQAFDFVAESEYLCSGTCCSKVATSRPVMCADLSEEQPCDRRR